MKKITIGSLFEMNFVSDVTLSPDASRVAFVVSRAVPKKNGYESGIWVLDRATGKAMKLTQGKSESSFIWEDDATILFPAVRGDEDKDADGKKLTAFYRISIHGGEAERAFAVDQIVTDIKKLSCGKYIVAAVCDLSRPAEKPAEDDWANVDVNDYHVVEEIPLWANGRGYVSRVRRSLFLFDPATGKAEKFTPELFSVSDWDEKGGKLLVTGQEYDAVLAMKNEVRLYDIASGAYTTVVAPGGYHARAARFTDSGIVIMMTDGKVWGSGQNEAVYRADAEGRSLRQVFASEELLFGCTNLTDACYGGGKQIEVAGDALYFIATEKGQSEVWRLTGEDKPEQVTNAGYNMGMFDIAKGQLVFAAQEKDGLMNIYGIADEKPICLYDANKAFFEENEVSRAEYLAFTDSDGVEIEGWVLKPIGYDPEKKYPGVLEVHGGPRCMYGNGFNHEMQLLAAKGYFVFFCNPRGSDGYGEAFADLRGKYGDIDYKDLMEFTDRVLEAYPAIDPARICETGGSYGGFMSNWIEGHTDRFAAIASCRSISNWPADFGGSEIGYSFDVNEMGTDPWTDVMTMWEHSPLKYANRAKTPILFIHSLQDYNCTIDQGVQMFVAVKFFGVPSRMCLFEGENHSLSRSGKPRHRARRLAEIADWFDKYTTK